MMRVLKCHLFLLFIFAYNLCNAQYILNDSSQNEISLHKHTSIVNVGSQNVTFDQIRGNFTKYDPQKIKNEIEDLGFTQSHYWTKTTIENQSNSFYTYYLETARPITDFVELYVVDENSKEIEFYRNGDAIPYKERSFNNRKNIFELQFPPNAKVTLFLHIKSDGEVLKLPLKLHSASNFISETASEELFFGFFYGILAIVGIIYFFFYFALQEKIFLYYTLYVFFVGLLQFSIDGLLHQYISHDLGWIANHAVLLIAIIAVYFSGKYSEEFLKIRVYSKKLYLLYKVAYISLLVLFLTIVLVPQALQLSYVVVNLLSLIFLLLIICSIIYLYVTKEPVDYFFTIGILCLISGFGIFILYNIGLLNNNFLTQNSPKFGTGLEIVFLSLSMSNLIRKLKNEKEKLNRIALTKSEEMSDLKSYFLSNISHELRTPLNAILNLTDLILKENNTKQITDDCMIIKESSKSLLGSINDIIDFSKIDKGEIVLEKKPFDLRRLIGSIRRNAETLAKNKGLDFVYSEKSEIPQEIVGDQERVSQILNNLLNNALKFTSKGTIQLEVEFILKKETHGTLIVGITDTGIGISDEKMNSIFDSFSQNSINNKRQFGGHGLGLFIVKSLVDLHQGTINVSSVIDKGTSCAFALDFEVVENKELGQVVAIDSQYDFKKKRILVVEDNRINQYVIEKIASKWNNIELVFANNGEEAITILKNQNVNIVLMDLQMPVMDGYEATIEIRKGNAGSSNAQIPIIAVTADVTEETRKKVFELGFDSYLTKPLKNDVLFAEVHSFLSEL